MKRVTSIGGIFFKSANPEATKNWYQRHLGLTIDQWGTILVPENTNANEDKPFMWVPFKADTQYFAPSEKGFMINYRVENLEWLVDELKKEGVPLLGEMEVFEYGKFVHLLDPDGNKIELWEPME